MSDVKRPALRYFGGKWRIAPWIISHFPAHTSYVEPFCGASSVLLRKKPAEIETINDKDGELINFFRVLRTQPGELIRVIELTPYARQEYKLAYEPTDDALESARRYYVRSWFGRGGMRKECGGWRYLVTDARGGSVVDDWRNIEHLREVVERLEMVQIECDDAINVVKRFDTPQTLFYIDPPYVLSSRSARWQKAYRFEMTNEEHIQLAKVLNAVQGMVVISGYPSALYDELYQNWRLETKKSRKENLSESLECLWINQAAQSSPLQLRLRGG